MWHLMALVGIRNPSGLDMKIKTLILLVTSLIYKGNSFLSFVLFVCLFVVSFSFLSFSFPWRSYLLQYLPRAVEFSHAGIFTRAEEEGGRFPQGTNGNNRRKFLIKRPKTFLGAAQNVFDH